MMSVVSDLPHDDPGLVLSDAALEHIQKLVRNNPREVLGIRIGVKKAGCSGYEYILDYALPDQKTNFDFCFEFKGFSIIVDKEIYLKFFKGGTIIDFRKEGINEGIKFENPNVGHQCGCGESFTLVDEDE